MGNCLGTCFGRAKRKTNYFVGRYKDYNVSIEFENLIEDDSNPSSDVTVITESERQHLLNKKFNDLEQDQRTRNAEIDAELRRQEENLKIEEESFNEARREAARLARQARAQQEDKKKQNKVTANGSAKPSWLGDDADWDVAGGEDDFEMFLDSVKARSQAVRANGFVGDPVGNSQPLYNSKKPNAPAKSTHNTTPSIKPAIPMTTSAQVPQQETKDVNEQEKDVNGLAESDMEWDGDFVSADTPESDEVMSGGAPFGGSDPESSPRTSDKSEKVTVELHKEQRAERGVKSADVNDNVPTPVNDGIDKLGQTSVQLANNILIPNNIDSALKQVHPATNSKTKALSNSLSQEPSKPTSTTKTENPVVETKNDKVDGGQGSTKVAADSIGSIDEFDIDKFLEELDFDT